MLFRAIRRCLNFNFKWLLGRGMWSFWLCWGGVSGKITPYHTSLLRVHNNVVGHLFAHLLQWLHRIAKETSNLDTALLLIILFLKCWRRWWIRHEGRRLQSFLVRVRSHVKKIRQVLSVTTSCGSIGEFGCWDVWLCLMRHSKVVIYLIFGEFHCWNIWWRLMMRSIVVIIVLMILVLLLSQILILLLSQVLVLLLSQAWLLLFSQVLVLLLYRDDISMLLISRRARRK